jgi:Lrp/AsnC family leucine-responsive transcriptional regulator/Lrp/AsnC family transcriptional regulator
MILLNGENKSKLVGKGRKIDNRKQEGRGLSEKYSTMTLDATDLRLLRLLQQNAKLTNKELAAELNLTVTPVYERVRRLEREGYIRKYVALLAPERLGINLLAFCHVSLIEHSTPLLQKFEEEVLGLQEVMECYHLAGPNDYLLKIVVDDMPAYQQFIVNRLAALENIGKVQSSFVMTQVKSSTELPI